MLDRDHNKSMKAAFIGSPEQIARVYGQGRRAQLEAKAEFLPEVVTIEVLSNEPECLKDVEVLFSTWGMPLLTQDQLDAMPKLKAVFYGAGAVFGFAEPLLERGIRLMSAWHANAVPVAEFTLAQILLSCKGYFRNATLCRQHRSNRGAPHGPGVFGETVALLGAGAIGTKLIDLLKPFNLNIIVFDPFLTEERAAQLGVTKVSLDEAFKKGLVVSNHLANKPETYELITSELIAMMREGATFINTGRGHTVDHDDLAQLMSERKDLTALLDVSWPEPLPSDSPLFDMPNVHLSAHIAGSLGDEVVRLADYVTEEFDRYLAGAPLLYEVTKESYARMA